MLKLIVGKKQAGDGDEEAHGQAASEVRLTPEQESRMEVKEASAMSEASGLTNEQDSDARPSASPSPSWMPRHAGPSRRAS